MVRQSEKYIGDYINPYFELHLGKVGGVFGFKARLKANK